jgi:hypothetical protein
VERGRKGEREGRAGSGEKGQGGGRSGQVSPPPSSSLECEKWTHTQWMACENKDAMEGIMHMKIKYKNAGTIFDCFHNRGHPETYIPGNNPKNYNALERVAVLSDEIADRVRDNCADWKGTPYIPGRSRFKMMYKGD